jgi:hypothetical protein
MPEPQNDNKKVVRFTGTSRLDWSPEEVFREALENNITDVIVIGRLPSGQLYLDHTQANIADVNWVLDDIKKFLFESR